LDPSPTIIESAPPPPVDDEGSSEEIAAFPRRPSEGHPTSISLPMFKFSDLVEIAAPYIGLHDGFYSQDRKHYACRCGQWFNSFEDHADHVAELVVSALTAELTGLAFDQSHPQPIRCVVDDCPQEFDTRELLNTHSYQSHLQANPFKTSTDPLVKYSRYPGVDEAGDFKWFGITTTSPKPK
jgi:hypothetical protein